MKETLVAKIYTAGGMTRKNVFESKTVLHIGCGRSKLPGAVGVDALVFPGVDVAHDLNSFPWPFEDNAADVIFAHSILEHLDPLPAVFEEIHRVGKPGARVVIAVPFFRSVDAFVDPTHKHFFTSHSLDYFLNTPSSLSRYGYTPHVFKKIGFWYGWPARSKNPLARAFKRFITAYPKFYDQYLSLIAPVKVLVWELEVMK